MRYPEKKVVEVEDNQMKEKLLLQNEYKNIQKYIKAVKLKKGRKIKVSLIFTAYKFFIFHHYFQECSVIHIRDYDFRLIEEIYYQI